MLSTGGKRLAAITLMSLLCGAPPVAANLDAERARFLEAEDALSSGQHARYKTLAESLVHYPLYPYLRYAELDRGIQTASPQEIADFLGQYVDVPVATRMRTKWLKRLADTKQWQLYTEFYQTTANSELRCHQVVALLETGRTEDALQQVESLWLTGKSQPDACDPAFAAWRDAGHMTETLVWRRVGLAMDAGKPALARYLKRFLPNTTQTLVDLWTDVYANPSQVGDDARFRAISVRLHAIRLWGMLRLARVDVDTAERVWRDVEKTGRFTEPEIQRVRARIGLTHAINHRHQAIAWFDKVDDSSTDQVTREWRVLIAIRFSDWQRTLHYIERMPDDERADERWSYWWARAAEQLGQIEPASEVFRALAEERNYYGFLAADRLGLPYAFNAEPLDFSQAELDTLTAAPAVTRTQELFRLERWIDARREWRDLTSRTESPRERAMLAVVAHNWQWHGRAILTIASTPYLDDLDLRFPAPFVETFHKQANNNELELAWVYAVARQESAFMMDARSPAGALGLMQIMPATGKYIAGKIDVTGFSSAQLLRPEVNIRFGTWYLRSLLERVGQNPVLATAGYNAGPHRVTRWLPRSGDMQTDIWVETIPFRETRKYVRRVFAYTAIYEKNLNLQARRLSERFATIKSGY